MLHRNAETSREVKPMQCPRCQGTQVVKNGTIHNGKPKWKCKDCQRQFVVTPTQRRITDETKQTIDKLLLERISLAGIVPVTGVSLRVPPVLPKFGPN